MSVSSYVKEKFNQLPKPVRYILAVLLNIIVSIVAVILSPVILVVMVLMVIYGGISDSYKEF